MDAYRVQFLANGFGINHAVGSENDVQLWSSVEERLKIDLGVSGILDDVRAVKFWPEFVALEVL